MKQKFIEWFTRNNNGCSPAMEDDRSFVSEKAQHMFEAYQAGVAEGEARCAALAAENAGLKAVCEDRRMFIMNGVQLGYIQVPTVETDPALETIRLAVSPQEPTPNTDDLLAEVRTQGRNEGINYVAGRLAAAFNHGFVDKPLSEVYDVVRMILTAKEGLANDPFPATDGLYCEYAEKFLGELAAQLHCQSVPSPAPLSLAITDIIAERHRQQSAEGWTPEHDDEHDNGELAMAAVCYINETGTVNRNGGKPWGWPWDASWWKPDGRRRNLVKAGALIAAEVERIDRAARLRKGVQS